MFGAATPKRQYAWSNSRAIRKLDVGWKRMKAKVKTCEHYYNKAGKKCWKGTRFLKQTQEYPVPFANNIAQLRGELVSSRPFDPLPPMRLPTGPEILDATPNDQQGLFATADLPAVYTYLRRGKGLKLPPHWQPYMPHELPETIPFLEQEF